jgi:hypothetical protein
MPRETQQPETYTVTTECFTAAPVTASMNLRLTGDSGQGNRRNMRRMVAEILGNRSDCSLEKTMVLCLASRYNLQATGKAGVFRTYCTARSTPGTPAKREQSALTCSYKVAGVGTSNDPRRPMNRFPLTLPATLQYHAEKGISVLFRAGRMPHTCSLRKTPTLQCH